MNLIQGHLIKFKNAKTYTLAIAEKLDANNYAFKPVKEEMSFNEQLVHIAENIYWLSSTYIKEESNPVKGKKIIAQEMNKEQVIQKTEINSVGMPSQIELMTNK